MSNRTCDSIRPSVLAVVLLAVAICYSGCASLDEPPPPTDPIANEVGQMRPAEKSIPSYFLDARAREIERNVGIR